VHFLLNCAGMPARSLAPLAQGRLSLRLKNGCARDDAAKKRVAEIQIAPLANAGKWTTP
jgi:hypothetical protein